MSKDTYKLAKLLKSSRLFILLISLLASTTQLFARELSDDDSFAKEINWYVNHEPPSMIQKGPRKGEGFIDKIIALIQEQLNDYEHDFIQATFSRTMHDLKTGKPVCYPALIRTKEREKYIAFSQLSVMHPSNYVTMSLATADQLQIKTEVELQKLLAMKDLFLGLESGRSFGPDIDNIIEKHGIETTMTFKPGNSIVDLYRMLTHKRVDYLIGYPFEANYALASIDETKDYRSFAIKGIPHFTAGAVGCTNSEWGRAVISAIDESLSQIKSTQDYQTALTFWLEDFVVNDEFQQYYQDVFLRN